MNSDKYHEYLLAVPWADAVVNPVNTRWNEREIARSLCDSDTRVLFIDENFAAMLPALREQHPALGTVIFCGEGEPPPTTLDYESLVAGAGPVADAQRGGDQLFGLFYTGGTTGRAKGVMLTHRGLLISALGAQATGGFISPGGTVLHAAPMFHLADLATWVCGLMARSIHVMVPKFTVASVFAAIAEHRVTDTLLVPTMIQLLADSDAAERSDLCSMRRLIYGASPISRSALAGARALFPGAGFTHAYGMTETSPVLTLLLPEDHDDPGLLGSVGRPAPHCEIRIVDAEDREVPRGSTGEIVARGDHVMIGYWRQEEQTRTTLRDGWMHTGDAGYMNEGGYLFIVDRIKDMILSGGENVYSVEVENVLVEHPAVHLAAVVGIPDELLGERVHAVVVRQPGQHVTGDELRAFCRARIAGYKTPRTMDFVERLPISGAGKILKRTLREDLIRDAY
jgi:acyl-CoA synthetase (AMP-forming)/AMP-acid ligase II